MEDKTATAEEVAAAEAVAAESTEVVEEEVETEEVETTQDDHLTPELAKNVENFASLETQEEKDAYIVKLKKGGRTDAIKAIQDVHGIKIETEVSEDSEEKDEVYRKFKQENVAKSWLESQGIKMDAGKALLNKEFVKQFHSKDLESHPLEVRTELALSRSLGKNSPDAEKRAKAATFTQGVKGNAKKEVDKDSFIGAILKDSR